MKAAKKRFTTTSAEKNKQHSLRNPTSAINRNLLKFSAITVSHSFLSSTQFAQHEKVPR
jgi:hypothetical protein